MGCQQSTAVPVPPPPRSLNCIEQMGWVSFRSAFEPSKLLKYDFSSVPHLRLLEGEDSAECRFRYTFLPEQKGYAIELEMEPDMVWYLNENGQVDIQAKSLTPPDRMVWMNTAESMGFGHVFRLRVPHPSPQFWLPYPVDIVVNTDGTLTTTHTESDATVFETVKIARGDDGKLIHLHPYSNNPFNGIKERMMREELEIAVRQGRDPRPILSIKPFVANGPNPIDYAKMSALQRENGSTSNSCQPSAELVTADMHLAMAIETLNKFNQE